MLAWAIRWIVWFVVRLMCSLACLFTIQFMVKEQGYYIPTKTLMVVGALLIVGVRVWMNAPSLKNNEKDISWGS